MPGHPRLCCLIAAKTWMPGTRPGITSLTKNSAASWNVPCFQHAPLQIYFVEPPLSAITSILNEPTHCPRRRLHVPGPFRRTTGAQDLRGLSQGDAVREPGDPRALERRG